MIKLILLLTGIFFMTAINTKAQDEEQEYKMKTYYFVLLKTGPNKSQDTAVINKAFTGHMANINAMADLGKLKLAGPFVNGGDYRGIFIIDAATEEEVKELLSKDNAIAEGFLLPEIKKWYGPAGLKVDKQ